MQAAPVDEFEDSQDEWLNFGEFCQALYEVCFMLCDAYGESEVDPAELLAVPHPCKRQHLMCGAAGLLAASLLAASSFGL